MATGLKIPIGVDKSGGAAVESNSQQQLKKVLLLALSESGDDNPFTNLGLSPNLIFKIKDAGFRALAQREIERVIAQFSERILIPPNESITFDESEEGRMIINFKYLDLETNKQEDFTMMFSR